MKLAVLSGPLTASSARALLIPAHLVADARSPWLSNAGTKSTPLGEHKPRTRSEHSRPSGEPASSQTLLQARPKLLCVAVASVERGLLQQESNAHAPSLSLTQSVAGPRCVCCAPSLRR